MEVINVIAELSFDVPIAPEELAKLQCSDGWCFGKRRVRLLGLFLARDRKRAVLLFQAPDAESVRQAFRQTQTHFDDIWPCATVDAGTQKSPLASDSETKWNTALLGESIVDVSS